jgi:hypothetical protein
MRKRITAKFSKWKIEEIFGGKLKKWVSGKLLMQ